MSFNITTDIFNVYEEEIRVYYSTSSGKASKIMGGGINTTTMFKQL